MYRAGSHPASPGACLALCPCRGRFFLHSCLHPPWVLGMSGSWWSLHLLLRARKRGLGQSRRMSLSWISLGQLSQEGLLCFPVLLSVVYENQRTFQFSNSVLHIFPTMPIVAFILPWKTPYHWMWGQSSVVIFWSFQGTGANNGFHSLSLTVFLMPSENSQLFGGNNFFFSIQSLWEMVGGQRGEMHPESK